MDSIDNVLQNTVEWILWLKEQSHRCILSAKKVRCQSSCNRYVLQFCISILLKNEAHPPETTSTKSQDPSVLLAIYLRHFRLLLLAQTNLLHTHFSAMHTTLASFIISLSVAFCWPTSATNFGSFNAFPCNRKNRSVCSREKFYWLAFFSSLRTYYCLSWPKNMLLTF